MNQILSVMKRFFVILLMLTGYSQGIAQTQNLSLEEAVIGQWRTYYPAQLYNLTWRGETDAVTFHASDYSTIMELKVGDKEPKALFTAEELSTAAETKLSYLPRIRWENENEFHFNTGGELYRIAWDGKAWKLKSKIIQPEAENIDHHMASDQIAFTKDNNLHWQNKAGKTAAITTFEDPNIVSGQAIARYEFGIGKGTFWSPDGSYLAFYQKDETDVADYPLLDITETPGKLKTVKYPMAGQKSEYAKVGIFDTKTEKTIYLQVEGPKDQYLTNLGWGPDNKFVYVAVVNRGQNHAWLNQYEAATGKFVKTLLEETHDKYVEPEHPVWFIPGKKDEFLWWSERDGFMHLHHYKTDGTYLGQITKGNWVTKKILGLDKKGDCILVEGTDESGLNTSLYMADLKGKKPTKRLVATEGIHRFNLSGSKKYVVDQYSDINTPNKVRILNLKGKEQKVLLEAPNPYKENQIATPELVTLKAKDGTPLQARLIKPVDFDPAKKYPVIVYVYGGPHAQMVTNSWLANASLWMYHAANKGYLVFTLDNRGSANRGFEFENIIHRQLSKNEMEDQMVGVEYLKSLPYANTDKMAVHGWSYGGFMTTSMMLKYPDVFKVGVAGGPVTDWKYYEVMYGERYMDQPDENPEGYKETRLANYVDQLKGDLLLIHGTVDDVVVMQHNLSLVKAFIDAGVLVDFFPYPMHPHNVRGKDRVHLMNKVLTYIDDKLK